MSYPYNPYPTPPQPKWNGLAIAGFILSFLGGPVGLILSVVGLNQAKRTGEKGAGLAVAGIVIGALNMVLGVILAVALIVGGIASQGAAATASDGSTPGTVQQQPRSSKPYGDAAAYAASDTFHQVLRQFNTALADTDTTATARVESADTIRIDLIMHAVPTASVVSGVDGWTDKTLDDMESFMQGEAARADTLTDTVSGVRLHVRLLAEDGTVAGERTYTAG